MRGLGRHWGDISSSSWGKETIRDKVSYQTRREDEKMIQARKALEDEKMTQAKILELRMEFLVDAISKCHMAVATRKRWKEIEASMDAVEIAWDRVKHTSWEDGNHLLLRQDLPKMVERVFTKAEKYLAKAEKYAEAQMGSERWATESQKPRKRVSNADRKVFANPESFCDKFIIG